MSSQGAGEFKNGGPHRVLNQYNISALVSTERTQGWDLVLGDS